MKLHDCSSDFAWNTGIPFFVAVLRDEPHNHVPDEFEARRGLFLKRMHANITQDPTVPVRRVYDDVIVVDSDDSDNMVPQFDNVRSRLKRFRSNLLPPIPSAITDVDIRNEWSKTWNGKKFLSMQDNVLGVAIFMTKKMSQKLADCTCLYIDGTFKTAPHPYKQMVTIHGLYNGFVIPLTFCLLTGKTTAQYQQLLQHVKLAVQRNTGRNLDPDRIVIDFEASLKIAAETEFPNSVISGCYFHFCSSLWRKIQKLGLCDAYNHDSSFKLSVRMIMAIAFIPSAVVRYNFDLFSQSHRTISLVRRYPAFQTWIDYVLSTYIVNNAAFQTPMWNVHSRNVDTRSNNHLEGIMHRPIILLMTLNRNRAIVSPQ